jgi:hypothetical protein
VFIDHRPGWARPHAVERLLARAQVHLRQVVVVHDLRQVVVVHDTEATEGYGWPEDWEGSKGRSRPVWSGRWGPAGSQEGVRRV